MESKPGVKSAASKSRSSGLLGKGKACARRKLNATLSPALHVAIQRVALAAGCKAHAVEIRFEVARPRSEAAHSAPKGFPAFFETQSTINLHEKQNACSLSVPS